MVLDASYSNRKAAMSILVLKTPISAKIGLLVLQMAKSYKPHIVHVFLLRLSFVQHLASIRHLSANLRIKKGISRVNDAAEHTTLVKKYKPGIQIDPALALF